MSDRGARQRFVAIAAGVAIAASGCGSPQGRGPHRGSRDGVEGGVQAERATVAAPATAASANAQGASGSAPHGDHNPHHGGVVLMNGDLHYEVVLDPAGRSHRLFFSDAVREDLPASIASSVALTIRRPGATDELIPLQIDGTGESWAGSGQTISDPAKATVRVAFTIKGESYWIDVPFAANK